MFLPRAAIAFAVSCLPAAAQVWDPVAEFSGDHGNPNGVWSYGWSPIGFGTFNPYTNFGDYGGTYQWWGWNGDHTPCIWHNRTNEVRNNILPGELSLHPGPGTEPTVLRWIAPEGVADAVRVRGVFGHGDIGGMTVAVRVNNVEVWSAINNGAFDLRVQTVAGTTIDFAVFDDYWYGNTPLAATIALACAPDFNNDDFLTFEDFDAFVAAFEAGDALADFNADGFLTFEDFDAFVAEFEAGC
ncbi:MAG: EF-hand domain-containing protein [Planctomycetota bacterium]|nr:EF-hand domain-containing protein [Planctomycetota bacterium]